MKIEQPGIILFVERYEECVAFYRDALGLPVATVKDLLTCFDFGGAYLMVEDGGISVAGEKTRDRNPAVLRFNVENVESAADDLRRRNVCVEVREFDWGVIGIFQDPDGNRCELKNAV